MSQYVGMYVSHCDLCLRTKIQHHLPTGELQLLPILEERWDVISIDFILELPESGGYNSIMVAVDSAGKCSHFIETVTTVTAAGEANLYLRNVDTQIAIVFESPVPGLEKDRDWTGLRPVRTGKHRTA